MYLYMSLIPNMRKLSPKTSNMFTNTNIKTSQYEQQQIKTEPRLEQTQHKSPNSKRQKQINETVKFDKDIFVNNHDNKFTPINIKQEKYIKSSSDDTNKIKRKDKGNQRNEIKHEKSQLQKEKSEELKKIELNNKLQLQNEILNRQKPQKSLSNSKKIKQSNGSPIIVQEIGSIPIKQKYIEPAIKISDKVKNDTWKPAINNNDNINTQIVKHTNKEVFKPNEITYSDSSQQIVKYVEDDKFKPKTIDTSSSQQISENVNQLSFKPHEDTIFTKILLNQQSNINPEENQLIKVTPEEPKIHFNIPSKQKSTLAPTIVRPKITDVKINELNKLVREISNDFPSITGDEHNKRVVTDIITNKLSTLNDMLESYEAKEHNMEIELNENMFNRSVNDIKYILDKNFKILRRLVKIIGKLMGDNFIFSKNVTILKDKINTLQQNENSKFFRENFGTIDFYINMVREELNKPIKAYMTNSYVNVARIIDDANTHIDLMDLYLNKPNPSTNVGKLDLDVEEAKLYTHVIVDNKTLQISYNEVSNLIQKVATELEKSKKEITLFLKDKEPNPIDAEIYNFKLLQIKNQLDTFMDILIHKKYMDYGIDTKNNINRLETIPNEDINMNKFDININNGDINGMKNFINNIDSNDINKWKKYSIIYQKIAKITDSNIRQIMKRHLFIRMPGWNDPANYKGYERPIGIFYDIAEKTLEQSGEPSIDNIIIDILLSKKIQESLEGLRNIDVKMVELFKQYGDQTNFDRLFTNLMLLQFNNFITKMRIYCGENNWGEFIGKFTDTFNEKMEQI